MQHNTSNKRVRSTFYLLILTEVLSLLCDLVSIVLLYTRFFLARTAIESLIYVIKLKIEFVVLNRLTRLVKHNANLQQSPFSLSTEEDSAPGRHSLFQGFTETFSPIVTLDERTTVSESQKTSAQQIESSSKSLVKRSPKTLAFITRSPIVDEEPTDDITRQASSASMFSLERQYLGRFSEGNQV
jgi:hypothetical protein